MVSLSGESDLGGVVFFHESIGGDFGLVAERVTVDDVLNL